MVAMPSTPAMLVAMSKILPPPSQADTIDELLTRSNRDAVPIRKTFLQQGRGQPRKPGPIRAICRHRDERGLDLYLVLHAIASGEPYDTKMPAAVWARVLGLSESASARSAVSKTLGRLEHDYQLIRRSREGNEIRIMLLDEDGSGADYTRPTGQTIEDRYLQLPHSYWAQGWHLRLSLRAKVVLMIGLSLDDGFPLPAERGPDWYGLSADTLQRGLAELQQAGLLDVDQRFEKATLSATGWIEVRRYTLSAPFGPRREAAADELATVTALHR
jgi:hypothetical protein